jgi:hypothetical protein
MTTDTLMLLTDLREILERDAEQEARSISDIVNEAVERYLRERQRAKLDQEIAAYESMHAELWQKYPTQWVAIHKQKLVDHDSDRQALYRRVRARYGRTSVLIREVTDQSQEEIWLRTPSTGRIPA